MACSFRGGKPENYGVPRTAGMIRRSFRQGKDGESLRGSALISISTRMHTHAGSPLSPRHHPYLRVQSCPSLGASSRCHRNPPCLAWPIDLFTEKITIIPSLPSSPCKLTDPPSSQLFHLFYSNRHLIAIFNSSLLILIFVSISP